MVYLKQENDLERDTERFRGGYEITGKWDWHQDVKFDTIRFVKRYLKNALTEFYH